MGGNGLIAYLVTPLSGDGHDVRPELFEPYVDRLIECCNLAGMACLANDFPYFSDQERRSIAAEVIRTVRDRVPVYVCTSAISTLQAIELSKHAEDQGASKVIINPQSYLPLDDEQILKHYERIAHALRIPVHIYNNPTATRTNMSVGLLRRIVDATGSRSIKEAGSSVEKFQELRAEFGDEVVLHVGFHYMALGGFALGAKAWDAGLVPSIAVPCERLFRTAVIDKDLETAQSLFSALLPLFHFFREKGALPSLKVLAAIDGLELGGTRAPIEILGSEEVDELQRCLAHATHYLKGIDHGH
jgi:4-hydroxy-tetrahydrodipicolinate synthase